MEVVEVAQHLVDGGAPLDVQKLQVHLFELVVDAKYVSKRN